MIRATLTLILSLAALPALATVKIEEVTTPGGIDAWLVESHDLPFASVEIRFAGGTSVDTPDALGAVNLMTGLLEEGAGDMDSRAFAEARETLAASIGFSSNRESVSVSLTFLTETRDEVAELVRLALTEPAFDPVAVERVREQVLTGLRFDLNDPGTIASLEWSARAWGDHPYGRPSEGTIDSVTALTRDDLVAAHGNAIARDRVFVGAVGDLTPEQLSTFLDTILGGLPDTGAPEIPEAEFLLEGGLSVVPYDTPQSVARFGHSTLERDHPDFFPLFVVNEVMGGNGFRSRLGQEVRVKRGLTYGIGTYVYQLSKGDMLLGAVNTVNPRMGETVEVLRDEWAKLARDGITADELDRAKTYLTGAYPLRFDGNSRIAGILVGMQLDGMPIDYVETRNAKVEAVTLEEANRVAAEYFRPDDLHILIVGQPEGVTPTD